MSELHESNGSKVMREALNALAASMQPKDAETVRKFADEKYPKPLTLGEFTQLLANLCARHAGKLLPPPTESVCADCKAEEGDQMGVEKYLPQDPRRYTDSELESRWTEFNLTRMGCPYGHREADVEAYGDETVFTCMAKDCKAQWNLAAEEITEESEQEKLKQMALPETNNNSRKEEVIHAATKVKAVCGSPKSGQLAH